MVSASEYLRIHQANAFRHPRYGMEYRDEVDDSERSRSVLSAVLVHATHPGVADEIPGRGLNLHRNLRHFEHTLAVDLRSRIADDLQPLWGRSLIGVLPTGEVNGCAFRDDGRGNTLDHYLIVLNYGLILACNPLADALTVEILEGDLAAYAGDGGPAFRHAVELYLNPSPTVFNWTLRGDEWPPDVEGQFAVHSGALATIMLQFVALHEFGHVVNGDVDSASGLGRFSAVGAGDHTVEYRRPEEEAEKNWPCEFAADRFAVEMLCDWRTGASTCWPNVAQVYLFFGWLEQVERAQGRQLSPYHPPPAERKQAVLRRAFELQPEGPAEDYFGWLDAKIAGWAADPAVPKTN